MALLVHPFEEVHHNEEVVHEVIVREVLVEDIRQEVQDLDLQQLLTDLHEGLRGFPNKHEGSCK